jgi:hypothetical protein
MSTEASDTPGGNKSETPPQLSIHTTPSILEPFELFFGANAAHALS